MFATAYVIAAILLFWLAWESVEHDNQAAMVSGFKRNDGPLVKLLVASLFALGPLLAGAGLWYGWRWVMG